MTGVSHSIPPSPERLVRVNVLRSGLLVVIVYLTLVGVCWCITIAVQLPASVANQAPLMLFSFWQCAASMVAAFVITACALLWAFGKGNQSFMHLVGGRDARCASVVLSNIVEEVAEAAGIQTPSVFELDWPSPNAFALGWKPNNGLIAVTGPLIRMLSRDELKAVVAHETAHIVNRDTILNTTLAGLCAVVPEVFQACVVFVTKNDATLMSLLRALMVGVETMGRWLGRCVENVGSTLVALYAKVRVNGSMIALVSLVLLLACVACVVKCAVILVLTAIGLVLVPIVVVVAVVAGHGIALISRFSVSREREFLADATAVKLTRHPQALIGALTKLIGVSDLSHPALAPLLFQGLSRQESNTSLRQILCTHPSLEARIQRIERIMRDSEGSGYGQT